MIFCLLSCVHQTHDMISDESRNFNKWGRFTNYKYTKNYKRTNHKLMMLYMRKDYKNYTIISPKIEDNLISRVYNC